MNAYKYSQKLHVAFVVAGWVGMLAACGDNIPLGTQDPDSGATGTGGAPGSGGSGSGGKQADAAVGTGGAIGGSGGTLVADAPVSTGGVGGGTGGRIGTGGAIGAGGATGTGGSTVRTCGGLAGITCPAGQFCDLASSCGAISDATGTCAPTGAGIACTMDYTPVCGCDGKTYSNDCMRTTAGVLKASNGACAGGTGGKTGTGGAIGTGGKTGTGGAIGTGGKPGTGGATTAGGTTGTGGATGTGGSTAKTCGGMAGGTCATGQLCDLASNCGAISDATGTCMPTGGGCTADYNPVCGCDGKTYSNDCTRIADGVLKASDGACAVAADAGATACAAAYLAWQAPGGFAGTGPAVAVCGRGWADTWTNVSSFPPETPPSSAAATYAITSTQSDDLFARLAAVDLTSLPHASTTGAECSPALYLRTCATCAARTLSYNVASQLRPEMEQVWLWFDQLLGASAATNPRNYCNF